ncbi:MAG: TspO/MBR family protein [Minisyncoccia bacterium]|jgi:tryptophan-rich sensory protein
MELNTVLKLVAAIMISELAGVLGSVFTIRAIPDWYATLKKPKLNPPGWVFGPVWTILYLLMGISAFLVWQKGLGNTEVRIALILFAIQLVLNALWSIVFFGWRRPLLAFANIALMWLAIIATMISFLNISLPAFYLLLPYIIWVSFAAYLNFAIVRLN